MSSHLLFSCENPITISNFNESLRDFRHTGVLLPKGPESAYTFLGEQGIRTCCLSLMKHSPDDMRTMLR